ncbi:MULTISPECIES: saccharopine dehydrogenase NADP-binding domain-containing protein [Catenuloplanes]|uniref:NAD(P)-dependent dehydrogenase (Short-subunit alcohol dehydrogenase family) n=1 Tax=Catenuloplanes niger TaxID=587534 RepID=A0AAE3ZX24_9ACTN|nr:saccharopine dehydrogenase NADP-binding domain-containing protein [Catenuloplanes niger]MDR7327487.1 NAD(P)-dependent dehydrogenase (short-subunit alcohol dehydrogenase family) [Catenuloplanes niger]
MIGVLGGSGAVGRTAVERLAGFGLPLRVGGRDRARAEAVAGPGGGDAVAVDLFDDDSLAAFCDGCAVVVNCAGPSYRVLDRVARAALAADAGYVDAAGDLVAVEALGDTPARHAVVFSAGLMPGLSGLLPRLLLDGTPVARLDVYVGGSVEISPASAVDALLTRGPKFGHALAMWRDGGVAAHSLAPLRGVSLPGFRGRVHAVPFLSAEMVMLASGAGVGELRNYTVYATENLPEAFATAWADQERPPEAHADAIVWAAARDVAAHGHHYAVLAYARPPAGSGLLPRRVLLRTPDSYRLSGVTAAITAREVAAGTVPPGVHYASEALDPRRTAAELAADALVSELAVPEPAR